MRSLLLVVVLASSCATSTGTRGERAAAATGGMAVGGGFIATGALAAAGGLASAGYGLTLPKSVQQPILGAGLVGVAFGATELTLGLVLLQRNGEELAATIDQPSTIERDVRVTRLRSTGPTEAVRPRAKLDEHTEAEEDALPSRVVAPDQ